MFGNRNVIDILKYVKTINSETDFSNFLPAPSPNNQTSLQRLEIHHVQFPAYLELAKHESMPRILSIFLPRPVWNACKKKKREKSRRKRESSRSFLYRVAPICLPKRENFRSRGARLIDRFRESRSLIRSPIVQRLFRNRIN